MASSRRHSFFRFDSRLSRRLLRYMVAACLIWALIAAILLAYFGYRGGLDYVQTRLEDIKASAPPSFAYAIEQGDHDQINIMLQAIERLPEITYAEIRPGVSGEGEIYLHGDKSLPHTTHLEIPLNPGHPEGPQLSIAITYSHMLSSLIGYLLLGLFVVVLGILVVGIIMNFIFHQTVTRHLEDVVGYLWDMDVVTLNHRLGIDRPRNHNPDEIDVLVDAVNTMRSHLAEAIEETTLTNRVLEENELSQAKLLSNLPGMVYRCLNNENWDMSFLSDGCKALTGYEAEALIIGGENAYAKLIHPEDREKVWMEVQAAIASKRAFRMDYRIVCADGSTRWVWEQGEAIFDEHGEALVLEGFVSDFTSRRQVEESLRESERTLRALTEFMSTLLDTIPSPVFYKDNEGRFLGCNEIFARDVLGLPQDQIIGKRLMDLPFGLPSEDGQQYHQADLELIANPGSQQFEMELVCADGVKRLYYYSRATFQAEKGPADGIIGIMLDLTERKELEEQLVRSQKMEVIGQLAGGIAHDFNNLLQVIRNNVELAMVENLNPAQAKEDLHDAIAAVDRASSLTRQLLTYSRKQALDVREIHLDQHLRGMITMLRRIIREDIQLDLQSPKNLWSILADPVQFEQVLMNLCINASDAMPDGGELLISLENHVFSEGDSHLGELEVGNPYVRLAVRDSGFGMDEETQRRIFDPFFSTKEVGRGTGLGLSTAMGIMRQHGGTIDVSSNAGEGTTFEIYFPAGEDESLRVQEEKLEEVSGGLETLLLAEDDESVRKLTARTLEAAGYKVVCAADGAEALKLFQQRQNEIDLVLLDMVMPIMGGREAASEMRELKPDLRLLFISGYDPAENGLPKGGGLQLLNKPYAPNQLLAKIRSLLDA